MKVYLVKEEFEGTDGIREFSILGTYFSRNTAIEKLNELIEEDQYGLIKYNGIEEQKEDFIITNFDNGFVQWEVAEELVHDSIPEEIKNAIYDEVELKYRTEDALRHAEDMGIDITEGEAVEIAQNFIDNYDCNVNENYAFESIMQDFLV